MIKSISHSLFSLALFLSILISGSYRVYADLISSTESSDTPLSIVIIKTDEESIESDQEVDRISKETSTFHTMTQWNKLPVHLRQTLLVNTFWKSNKIWNS